MIVTFANQKGGVGKSTLLILLANYLAQRGHAPLLVYTDHQKSLVYLRQTDLENFPAQDVPYDIVECDLVDASKVSNYINELRLKHNGIILIDAPGNLTESGLLQIFAKSDYLIVPFQYERKCLDSTGTFISALHQLTSYLISNSLPYPQLVFAPNRVKTNEGLKSEKEIWAKTNEALLNHGELLPAVKDLATIRRLNTFLLSKDQETAATDYLEKLYSLLICPITSSTN